MNTANSGWHQLLSGMVVGLVSVATVLAGVLLASQESGGPAPTSVALATPSATAAQPQTVLPTAFFTPGVASPTTAASPATPASTPTPGPTVTPIPTIACTVPLGWSAYIVRLGDSIESIARATATNVFTLIQWNCLADTDVTPGQILYLPPFPTRGPTPTRVPCGPPINWVIYRVQPGDTLYGLAVRYGTSVSALAQANCMAGYMLRAGQGLYVPPVVVVPPTATRTRVPSATATSIVPSLTPTATASIIPTTALPTSSPSSTPPSATPAATDTPQSPTPTVAPSVTPTYIPGPSATPSPTLPPSATPPPTHTSPPPTHTPTPPTGPSPSPTP